MTNPLNAWRRLFRHKEKATKEPATEPAPSAGPPADEAVIPEASIYLEQIRRKMERLAEGFAAGVINPTQFKELYAHYQRERGVVEAALEETPEAAAWRAAVAKGESGVIRRRHAAHILGYVIYLNANGATIRTVGEHQADAQQLASMLDRLRSDTGGPPEQQIHSMEIEDGHWVGFVPSQYTTLMVIFSVEPARVQLNALHDLQAHFERANRQQLARGIINSERLVFPHAVVFE